MENTSTPTFGHGKICYIEMPSNDVNVSAAFYHEVFNWSIRERGPGEISFDDGVGQVSGIWIKGAVPDTNPSLVVNIMVDDAEKTVKMIVEKGGKIVQPVGKDHPEITARFSDPTGNVLGIYQHRG